MSETTTAAPGEGAPAAAAESAPADTTPNTPAPAATEAAPEAPPETQPEQPPRNGSEPWIKRINRQSAKIADQARTIEALQARLAASGQQGQPPATEGVEPPPQPRQQAHAADDVEARAAQLVAERERQSRLSQWDEAGRKALPDFRERCAALAALGASEVPDFVDALVELDHSPQVVAHLTDNPEEATRILALSPHKRAIELARLDVKVSAPKPPPISRAPAPIAPVAGHAAVADDLSDDVPIDRWMAARNKQTGRR